MSGNEDTVARVKRVIAENLGVALEDVTPSKGLHNSYEGDNLDGDSLDIVELVMAIEKEFDIEIPDADAEEINTVQDAIDYVHDHV